MEIGQLLNPGEQPGNGESGAKHCTPGPEPVSVEANMRPNQAGHAAAVSSGICRDAAPSAEPRRLHPLSGSQASPTVPFPSMRTASPSRSLSRSYFEADSRPWTLREFEILLNLQQSGWGWDRITSNLPGRCVEACLDRLENPCPVAANAHPHWVQEEEEILVALKNKGYGWPEIADQLPARTPDACKNRWYEKYHQPPRKPSPWRRIVPQPELFRTFSSQERPWSAQEFDRTSSVFVPAANSRAHVNSVNGQIAKTQLHRLAPKTPSMMELSRANALPYGQESQHHSYPSIQVPDKLALPPRPMGGAARFR